MDKKQSTNELLEKLISHWCDWDRHETFYLEILVPQLIKKPESGDATELSILTLLRGILNDNEWCILPLLIREKRDGKLRNIEQEKIRQDLEHQAKQETLKKYEQEKFRAEQLEKEEWIKEEKKRQEKENILIRMRDWFESSFLSADGLYKEQYSEVISQKEYEEEKTRFVKCWIKTHTKTELDKEQAAAIAGYGKHIQVIARAGSGKTTTLVNRAIFLQRHCNVSPNHLLLLAFNKKAADEIKDRLEKFLGDSIPHVMTFHALAYAIVHPEEALLYDDRPNNSQAKSRSLQFVIDDFLHNPQFKDKISSLMLSHFRADWERIIKGRHDLEKMEFIEYRRLLPNVSLRGEYLKSYGEKLIADFLFEHDIPYNYEKNWWWRSINYRPDFTIYCSGNSGLIVEYFGLSGDPDYDELTADKRKYWQDNNSWNLIEITPKDVSLGREYFFSSFKQLLTENGVRCFPLSEEEIWNRIKGRAIDRFTEVSVGFIQRCRKLSLTPDQLSSLIKSQNDLSSVEEQFLKVAQDLYTAYLERLSATGEEDFDGLMQRAAQNIGEGQSVFERKSEKGDLQDIHYMFIDEYQDFSDLFLKLIKAIRLQNDQVELFCVGDDWQAINGFSGSDLKFYNNFQQYFSPSRELYISTNYRSSKSIVALGNTLMEGLGPPANTHKPDTGTILLANLEDFTPSPREIEKHSGDTFTPAVLRLLSKLLAVEKNVVLLSRKNRFRKSKLEAYGDLLRSYFPEDVKGRISTSTTHKYKGLQSDAVIIVDAVLWSYPLIHPDWIFTRIFGDDIDKITSEEMRLFYVALTRAADTLIIITEGKNISPFLQKILARQALKTVDWDKFLPVKENNSRLTIRIDNINQFNKGATFAIKDQLKASGFQWDSNNKVWQKSFLENDFVIGNLTNSIWSSLANQIRVSIVNDHGSVVEEHVIYSGHWTQMRKNE